MLSFVMLVIGFVLLVWGADKFVEGASALARKMGVSPLLVGLTIVAFGTSMPELAVSVTAALRGANEIAVGNVVGSNVFNLLVVAGLSAVICPLVMDKMLLRRDWPLSIFAAVLLLAAIAPDHVIARWEGAVLLVIFAVILSRQIKAALNDRAQLAAAEAEAAEEAAEMTKSPVMIWVNIVLGLACIVLGGQLAVNGATGIARMFGLSETLIGRHRHEPARAGHLDRRGAQGTERDRHGQCDRLQSVQYSAHSRRFCGYYAYPGAGDVDY